MELGGGGRDGNDIKMVRNPNVRCSRGFLYVFVDVGKVLLS